MASTQSSIKIFCNLGAKKTNTVTIAAVIINQIVYTATTLGIFEELTNSLRPMTACMLALKLGLDADATERLLNALSALSLVEKSFNSSNSAVYRSSTCAEKYLVNSSPFTMKPLIHKVGDLYAVFGQLTKGIKEGRQQLNTALGKGDQCFKKGNGLYSDDKKRMEFLSTMQMFSYADAPHVLKAFDLKQYKTAIDLGGGTGAFGLTLAKKYPSMHVTVADLHDVVKMADQFLPKDVPENLHYEIKDFFEDSLTPADLYILSNVVHDWDVEHLDKLLTKVYHAIKPGGALLVLEKILNENKDGPLSTLILDLGMLVTVNGRERTAAEYKQLFSEYGFKNIRIKVLPEARLRDAILMEKLLLPTEMKEEEISLGEMRKVVDDLK
ncbi:hypothetical protein HELRODRAFT_192339 [Helobdella robusta]|uniref:Acetylserotonin O-methyltransferase n=1 Tax=Helobdella robusta TaxID=6412 RepID=T1FTU4_HELRO|nr:hypothetical protein HELRODRAFT_192339 [Helobdella robusta]ESO01445.1 hypothetical protein HELRODRAFT_192339 [Helobdella robusta]